MEKIQKKIETILVTGGSGYIGSMVCMLLVESGYKVINLDRIKKEIKGVKQYVVDLKDDSIFEIIKITKPSLVMHFAANHEVDKSMKHPHKFYENNVSNTLRLLDALIKFDVLKIIFSSTSAVYGNVDIFPTVEETPKNPINPYGKSKSIIEDILIDYDKAYGLKHVALRYFNAAGASPDLSHGYSQKPANHIVPIVAQKILSGETIEIFGDDFNTKDGTAERDYIHVYDIATAHLAALNYLNKESTSNVFNIGANNSNSVLEVIEAFKKITKKHIKYKYVERRPGDAPKTWADSKKAKKVLKWEPQFDLDGIVKHAFLWEEKKVDG